MLRRYGCGGLAQLPSGIRKSPLVCKSIGYRQHNRCFCRWIGLGVSESGQLSHDELLEEINRHLAIERASPVALLEILKSEQLTQPLRSDVHKSILDCIRNWPQDPTVITRSHEDQRRRRRPAVGVGEVLQGRFDLVELLAADCALRQAAMYS